jgi:hypothetical protein
MLTPYTTSRVIDGLSVTSAGRVGLTKAFITTYGVEPGMRAYMYWDATKKAMAFAFTRQADATAYPIIFTRQYGAFISARRFFRWHRLDLGEYSRRYPYSELDGEAVGLGVAGFSVFVVELTTPMSKRLAISHQHTTPRSQVFQKRTT